MSSHPSYMLSSINIPTTVSEVMVFTGLRITLEGQKGWCHLNFSGGERCSLRQEPYAGRDTF